MGPLTVDAHNHINPGSYPYDGAGNLTFDGVNYLKFDAENRLNPVTGYVYSYDGDNHRVEKNNAGSITYYWYDDNFNVISTTGNISRDYVYFNGRRIAFYSATSGNQHYYWSDHLGSARTMSNSSGSTIEWEGDYYPFGNKNVLNNNVDNYFLFTGYEFDYELGDNYADYREQVPVLGRFVSPDPYDGSMHLSNPQSLNRYAYVLNNPSNFTDPLGLDCKPGDTSPGCPSGYGPDGTPIYQGGTGGSDSAIEPSNLSSFYYWLMYYSNYFYDPPNIDWGGSSTGGNNASNNTPKPQPAPSTGFTLGIRQPGQTWKSCMSANANTYSIGGSAELAANVATGTNTSYSSNVLVGAVTGNSVNTFFFGSTADAAAGMAANSPGLVSTAMGSATTFGRRTSSIMSLNLAGTPGGPPLALSQASAGVKSVLGRIGNALSLGMSFATRTAVDVGFTGAEAINCAIPQ